MVARIDEMAARIAGDDVIDSLRARDEAKVAALGPTVLKHLVETEQAYAIHGVALDLLGPFGLFDACERLDDYWYVDNIPMIPSSDWPRLLNDSNDDRRRQALLWRLRTAHGGIAEPLPDLLRDAEALIAAVASHERLQPLLMSWLLRSGVREPQVEATVIEELTKALDTEGDIEDEIPMIACLEAVGAIDHPSPRAVGAVRAALQRHWLYANTRAARVVADRQLPLTEAVQDMVTRWAVDRSSSSAPIAYAIAASAGRGALWRLDVSADRQRREFESLLATDSVVALVPAVAELGLVAADRDDALSLLLSCLDDERLRTSTLGALEHLGRRALEALPKLDALPPSARILTAVHQIAGDDVARAYLTRLRSEDIINNGEAASIWMQLGSPTPNAVRHAIESERRGHVARWVANDPDATYLAELLSVDARWEIEAAWRVHRERFWTFVRRSSRPSPGMRD